MTVAGAQIEALDLAGDVDVIGAVEVVPVLAAKESVTLGQDFQHTLPRITVSRSSSDCSIGRSGLACEALSSL